MGTTWMVWHPASSRTRLRYHRDLYGVVFMPYLLCSSAAAAMRWACHSRILWRVVRNVRRWASLCCASSVLGCCRVVRSSFVVQMSWTCCWSVAGVAFHAARLCRPAHGSSESWCIRAGQDGVGGPGIPVLGAVVVLGREPVRGWKGVVRNGGCGMGYLREDEVDVEGSVARARGREVPVGLLVDAHHGWVPVARVNAGGMGAGLVGVVKGCAGESCCEVGEAQLVHGVPGKYVGRCGWASWVVVHERGPLGRL